MDNYSRYARHLEPAVVTGKLLILGSSAGRKEAIGRGITTCALEGQITAENAPRIKARAIVEGANGPTSSEANPILEEADVFVVPDILANAGG